jgi:hypothetical protein
MAELVTGNERLFSVWMFIAAGLWAASSLGIGLSAAIMKSDINTLVYCILSAIIGVPIWIYGGRWVWRQFGPDVASGKYFYYDGPVEIRDTYETTGVGTNDTTTVRHDLAFEGQLVRVDAATARRVERAGGWVGIAFTPYGFVFEVVDRQGQPLHRAAGYYPDPSQEDGFAEDYAE